MHQNTSRHLKKLFYGLDFGGLEMHKNTFLTTPDVKNTFFRNMILVVWKYAQMHQNTFFNHSRRLKISLLRTCYGGLEMHYNTFLTTPDI
jgi:hypothetical protein